MSTAVLDKLFKPCHSLRNGRLGNLSESLKLALVECWRDGLASVAPVPGCFCEKDRLTSEAVGDTLDKRMLVEVLVLLHVEVLNDSRVAYAKACPISDEEDDSGEALCRLSRVEDMAHDVEIVTLAIRF